MKDEIVSLTTARLAKEKGFDWPCRKYFDHEVLEDSEWNVINKPQVDFYITAPTQSLLARWLHETHKIFVYTKIYPSGSFTYEIHRPMKEPARGWERISSFMSQTYSDPQTTLEQGLQEALKLL